MNLYLVQHAKAKGDEEDPQRSLSNEGTAELRRVVSFVTEQGCLSVSKILHSGKLRAEQTAQAFAERLKPSAGLDAADGLKPKDDPSIWAERLCTVEDDTMLVGHLPHLGRLASLLLTGDASRTTVSFRNAGVVALVRDTGGAWTVSWVVTPQILSGR